MKFKMRQNNESMEKQGNSDHTFQENGNMKDGRGTGGGVLGCREWAISCPG